MIARTRALTPGSQCSHYADHRHPECVNMCTVCNNSSYLRLCLTPSIHSLWPVWGLSKQTPALFMPGLKPQTTIDHAGPACHPSQFFSDTDISGRQHTRIYFLPVCVCDTGPPSVPQRDFCGGQKAEPGSGANGYYMDPGRERGACQDYKLGSRTLGPSRQIFSDSTEWTLTILVRGLGRSSNSMRRSCLAPAEGDEFLSCDGQQ